jgi:putative copper export protein
LFIGRCSSSSLILVENIHNYTSMNILIILLYVVSVLLILLAQLLYSFVSREQLLKSYRWFCWCRKIFICLAIVSICNQLINTLACRSIDVLYDLRYISILIVQITGFLICLLFAFFLGIKYASIKHRDWSWKSSHC